MTVKLHKSHVYNLPMHLFPQRTPSTSEKRFDEKRGNLVQLSLYIDRLGELCFDYSIKTCLLRN